MKDFSKLSDSLKFENGTVIRFVDYLNTIENNQIISKVVLRYQLWLDRELFFDSFVDKTGSHPDDPFLIEQIVDIELEYITGTDRLEGFFENLSEQPELSQENLSVVGGYLASYFALNLGDEDGDGNRYTN